MFVGRECGERGAIWEAAQRNNTERPQQVKIQPGKLTPLVVYEWLVLFLFAVSTSVRVNVTLSGPPFGIELVVDGSSHDYPRPIVGRRLVVSFLVFHGMNGQCTLQQRSTDDQKLCQRFAAEESTFRLVSLVIGCRRKGGV